MLNGEKFTLCKNYRQLIEWSVTYIIWKFLKEKQKNFNRRYESYNSLFKLPQNNSVISFHRLWVRENL